MAGAIERKWNPGGRLVNTIQDSQSPEDGHIYGIVLICILFLSSVYEFVTFLLVSRH